MPCSAMKARSRPSALLCAQRVGRHGDLLNEVQALLGRNGKDGSEVTHTPGRIASTQICVELRVARGRVRAIDPEGAIKIQQAAFLKQAAGACHEALRRRPGRDVNHVDAHDRVRLRHRPSPSSDIKLDWCEEVRQTGHASMRDDAPEGSWVRFGWLPSQVRQSSGEAHHILVGAARHLENLAAARQDIP